MLRTLKNHPTHVFSMIYNCTVNFVYSCLSTLNTNSECHIHSKIFFMCMCTWYTCVFTCVWVYMCVCTRRPEIDVDSLLPTTVQSVSRGRVCPWTWSLWFPGAWEGPGGGGMALCLSSFCVGARNLNFIPRACIARTLSPFLWNLFLLLKCKQPLPSFIL